MREYRTVKPKYLIRHRKPRSMSLWAFSYVQRPTVPQTIQKAREIPSRGSPAYLPRILSHQDFCLSSWSRRRVSMSLRSLSSSRLSWEFMWVSMVSNFSCMACIASSCLWIMSCWSWIIWRILAYPWAISCRIGTLSSSSSSYTTISEATSRNTSTILSWGSCPLFILAIRAKISRASSVYLLPFPWPIVGRNSLYWLLQVLTVVGAFFSFLAISASEYVRLYSAFISRPLLSSSSSTCINRR